MGMEIEGKQSAVNFSPTITAASAYSSGQLIGGLMVFPRAFGKRQSGILHSLIVRDLGKQSSAMDLVIFKEPPTGIFTDKTTFNPSATDFNLITGVVSVLASDYVQFSAQSLACKLGIGLCIKNIFHDIPATIIPQVGSPPVIIGQALYAVLVCRGTPTYVTTLDLTVCPKILED